MAGRDAKELALVSTAVSLRLVRSNAHFCPLPMSQPVLCQSPGCGRRGVGLPKDNTHFQATAASRGVSGSSPFFQWPLLFDTNTTSP